MKAIEKLIEKNLTISIESDGSKSYGMHKDYWMGDRKTEHGQNMRFMAALFCHEMLKGGAE